MHKFIFQRLRKSLIFDPGIIQSRYESIQTEIRKHLDVYTNQLKVWINPGTHCSFRNPERFRIQRPVVRVGRGEHRDEDTWRRTSCSFGKNSWPSVPLVGSYTRSTLPGRVREKVFDPFLQRAVRTIGSERLRHLVRHQEPHATSPTSSSSRVVRADPRQGRRHRFESTICFRSTFHDGKFVECRPIRRKSKVVTGVEPSGFGSGRWTVGRKRGISSSVRGRNEYSKEEKDSSMDLSLRSEEGCESESQKFFIVFESLECVSIISVEFERRKWKWKRFGKKSKGYINLTRRFMESLKIYIYICIYILRDLSISITYNVMEM